MTASKTATSTPTAKTAAPTATATRSAAPTRSATPSAPPTYDWFVGSEAIQLDKTSGGNGETVQVTGTGWKTGERVTIVYLNALGVETGQQATAVPASDGTFTARLVCFDRTSVPGMHRIRARNASGQEEFANYNAQA